MQMKKFKWVVVALILVGALVLAGCEQKQTSRETGVKTQEEIMKKAQKQVPVPQVNNYLTRKTVAKWMKRQDTPSKMYYIYIFADTGNVIGYYTAQSRPVNICTFLTPPNREVHVSGSGANPLGRAPALDGVYYGEGSCNQWYFFDAETDAMIEITGLNFISTDQPLRIDAQPIEVQAK